MAVNLDTWASAVIYQAYVRAIKDSTGDGYGDLGGLIQMLDLYQDLGVTNLWLGPIYPSPGRDDGYDVSDFRDVNPMYGNLKTFDLLVREADQRGIGIMLDFVINHTSNQHPWFIDSVLDRNGKGDWYVWAPDDRGYPDARIIFVDTNDSNWTRHPMRARLGKKDRYWLHRFLPEQPDLNFDNPEVLAEMLDTMQFWIDKGIKAFRVDAPPYLIEREGTICENLPETHAILAEFRHLADQNDVLLMAEANQRLADLLPYFNEFHILLNFPYMNELWYSQTRQHALGLALLSSQIFRPGMKGKWGNFDRCHDEYTLEMVSAEHAQFIYANHAKEPRARINHGIRKRRMELVRNNEDRAMNIQALTMMPPGPVVIYYGAELGTVGDRRRSDRWGLRMPYPHNAGKNAGFSDSDRPYMYPRRSGPRNYRRVNLERQLQDPDSMFNRTKAMAQARGHPVFAGDQCTPYAHGPVFGLHRQYAGHHMLMLANLSEERGNINVPLPPQLAGKEFQDVLSKRKYGGVSPGRNVIGLRPYEHLWLEIK